MGKLIAVCISEKKGTVKKNIGSCRIIEDHGLEHDAHAEVTNRMNGKSEMTELTPTLASFFLTSRSTLTLKYFANAGKGGLIYVVNTITTDSLSDSTVKVYNSDWTLASPADQFKFHNPGSYNHVTVSDADNVVRVKEVIRPLLFEGESREDKPDVVAKFASLKADGTYPVELWK